ncbi:hypothetical protein WA026_005113 [Henosepilachna vigintioctopunctata]|uniref:CRAL-TRIO domain-containing protein n=1 Tax=Henosepilachna vigintioctopunctata TaxID=420089 RepID=A0AAW1UW19_9CUCU
MDIVQQEYQRDKTLKKEEVEKIQEWLKSQPHLPEMTEQEVIWFLKSCYSRNEAAKTTIDNYFTMKTLSPEILRNKDITKTVFQELMNSILFSVLPKKTPEGDSVVFFHFMDNNPDYFHYPEAIKLFDMVVMLDIMKNGTQDGLRCCFDVKNFSFGHLTRMGIIPLKKFLYYLQEGMPVRLKGLHFLNSTSVMDKLLQMMKPFLKKEIMESVRNIQKCFSVKSIYILFWNIYKDIN